MIFNRMITYLHCYMPDAAQFGPTNQLIITDEVIKLGQTGVVVAAADENDPLLNKRVFLTPMRGWECGDPTG